MLLKHFVALLSIAGGSLTATATADVEKRATGIVTRSGRGFQMDGKPFNFVGTNAYWATGLASQDLTSLFSQMNSAGLKVLRIFAWSDNVGGAQDSSFQYWSGCSNTPNAAAFAKHMDPIVSAAEAAGIKLVIPMIGNWGGSISLYIQQCVGSSGTHDTFYSNANIVNAYKKYINFFVNRYKNSPAVFAWELMNEPRCTGDDNRGASSQCNNALITSWVRTISSYIKSLDSTHMVTLGDEGWLTSAQGYSPQAGIDWVTNLQISTIDYGTVHLYPSSWGQSDNWGNQWITDHGKYADQIGKPVVLEEFGTAAGNRYNVDNGWLNSAYAANFNGIQYWQFVGNFPSGYTSPDDGNGISTSESTYALIKAMAVKMNAKNGGGSTGSPATTSAKPAATTTAKPASTSPATGSGTVAHYGQCGGTGWTGGTVCQSPYTCQISNAYYSQCL